MSLKELTGNAPTMLQKHHSLQSGGDYDLKLGVPSNDKNLAYDVIIASLGTRYVQYCANIARTYLVDPSKAQEAEYAAIMAAQAKAIASMTEGAELAGIVNVITTTLQVAYSSLLTCLVFWACSLGSAMQLLSKGVF